MGNNEDLFDGFDGFDSMDTETDSGADAFEEQIGSDMREMNDPSQSVNSFMDERLREMNKKLPEWSLEPPFSFLK